MSISEWIEEDRIEPENSEMAKRPGINDHLKKLRQEERDRRHKIVLWRKPYVTLKYFFLEALILLETERKK